MQSENLINSQSTADVCPVGTFVGNLNTEVRDFLSCPWCGELLPPSKTKPRLYCSEAHEKAFKRADGRSKAQEKLLVLAATDTEFAHYYFHSGLGTYVRETPLASTEKLVKDPQTVYTGTGCAGGPKNPENKELGNITAPPEPTPVLPEFRTFTPDTPLFIGPLLKNGRSRRKVTA